MNTAKCPLCLEKIDEEPKLRLGQHLKCPTCEADLAVIGLDPVALDWVYYDEYIPNEDDNFHKKTKPVLCPFCQEKIDNTPKLRLGHRVICPACDSELAVVGLKPVKLG